VAEVFVRDILDKVPFDLEVVDPFIAFPPVLETLFDDLGSHLSNCHKLAASHNTRTNNE